LDPRFVGSNTAEDDEFLRAIKFRIKTSFGGEVKPTVPCRKTLRLVKSLYSMKEMHREAKFTVLLAKFLLLDFYVSLLVTAREILWVNQE
jgi:hypothetical protein